MPPFLSCAFCAESIRRTEVVYFFGCRMADLIRMVALSVYTQVDTEVIQEIRQKPCCLECAQYKPDLIRATAVFNPQLWTPPIRGVYDKTQVELLRTILPDYDSQTQTLVEVRNERLAFLLTSSMYGPDQKKEIRKLIGNSPSIG